MRRRHKLLRRDIAVNILVYTNTPGKLLLVVLRRKENDDVSPQHSFGREQRFRIGL